MRASVVVPSYNGLDKFPRLIDALTKQTVKDFETILVIDGSKDDSYKVASANQWGLQNFNVIDSVNKGRSGARNTGAKQTKTELLIFVDDDIIPPPDFIAKHIAALQQHDIVVGILEPDNNFNAHTEFVNFSSHLNDKWNNESFYNTDEHADITYITANNFSIKKKVFDHAGGFDERLRDAEDFDLALKVKALGYHIQLDKNIIAKHMVHGSFKQYFKRMKEYSAARDRLVEINPAAAQFFQKEEHQFSAAKKAVFYLFSFKFWGYIADRNMLTFLPSKLRFKMYDMMLTANFLYR
jgi:glycosyltransferase involved in cell wall biosynthesis